MKIPDDLQDCRNQEAIDFDAKTADRYSERGTVQHFAMRLGFYPNDEEEAEAILIRLLLERDFLEMWVALHE